MLCCAAWEGPSVDEPIERDSTPVEDEDIVERDTTEISYDEQRYPARPRRLRPRDQMRGGTLRRFATDPRTANGTNPAYIEWLVRQSMLKDADVLGRQLSGQPSMWRNPYARPDARPPPHHTPPPPLDPPPPRDPVRGGFLHSLAPACCNGSWCTS